MSILIPFIGGPLKGKFTLSCEDYILYKKALYKLQTIGECKIPLRYKYIKFIEQFNKSNIK